MWYRRNNESLSSYNQSVGIKRTILERSKSFNKKNLAALRRLNEKDIRP